jgi:hypothetical protein
VPIPPWCLTPAAHPSPHRRAVRSAAPAARASLLLRRRLPRRGPLLRGRLLRVTPAALRGAPAHDADELLGAWVVEVAAPGQADLRLLAVDEPSHGDVLAVVQPRDAPGYDDNAGAGGRGLDRLPGRPVVEQHVGEVVPGDLVQ